MGLLNHNEILQLHAAVVSANLVESRPALLAGINPGFVARLPQGANPSDQILRDLDALGSAGVLADGTTPAAMWLKNALTLGKSRVEASLFADVRSRVEARADYRHASAAPGPTPHNLPLRRLFVGRAGALSILDDTLQRKRIASLFALAGTGKTALALEYAHRTVEGGAYPGGVWWVLAEGSSLDAMIRLAAALRSCVPGLLDHVRRDASAEEQAEAARVALQSLSSPSLLVLDNVSELGLAGRLPGGEVRVLATVRDRSWYLGEPIELDALDADESRRLVEALAGATSGEVEATACNWVVQRELGGLAAAVEVAARAVKTWAGSWLAYENYLMEQVVGALDDVRDRSQHYPRGVFAAIDLSIDQCPSQSTERALLVGAAMFAPDAVPRGWVLAATGVDTDKIEGKRALAILEGLGLLKVDGASRIFSLRKRV